jgi:hypothetical protein
MSSSELPAEPTVIVSLPAPPLTVTGVSASVAVTLTVSFPIPALSDN